MMRLPVIAVLLLATLLTVGCREEPTSRQAEFYVFGTLTGVTLWDVEEAQADRAFARLQETFRRMHRDWHAWEPGELTRINAAFARGEAITASEDIVELVRRSQELERLTGGQFNPAIGALIRLWGFHTSEYPIIGPPPDRPEVEALLAKQPSTRDIRIDGLRLESSNPAVQLDFGAVAPCVAGWRRAAVARSKPRGATSTMPKVSRRYWRTSPTTSARPPARDVRRMMVAQIVPV